MPATTGDARFGAGAEPPTASGTAERGSREHEQRVTVLAERVVGVTRV